MSPTRTNFNWVSKVPWNDFDFAFLSILIGSGNSPHYFNQSDSKLNPIASWLTPFSCASLKQISCFYFEFSYWLHMLCLSILIGLYILCPSILIGSICYVPQYKLAVLLLELIVSPRLPSQKWSPSAYVFTCLFICRKFAFHGLRICRIQEKIGRFTCNHRTPGLLDLSWSVWERYYKWWNEAAGFACRELNRQEARPRNSLTRRI